MRAARMCASPDPAHCQPEKPEAGHHNESARGELLCARGVPDNVSRAPQPAGLLLADDARL